MDTYSCYLHCFLRTQCQFNGSHYRCHAHLATDGTNHRNGLSGRNSRPEFVQESYQQLPHYHHSQRYYSYHYFSLSPITEAQSELLARTSPTLYDVLIALCGGAAGILAVATKGKNNVIPGVAIATALMPPLCTAGYGLAMGNISYFLGAFYLYFINTVFIAFTTCVGVRLMHFHRKR